MQNPDNLPIINPPFTGTPPEPGVRFMDKSGFTYEMIERVPHRNRDGTDSWLLTIRGTCADCGTLFLTKQGPTRSNLPRRCPKDAAGKGREKTHPWGSAPTGGSGKQDWELVQRFLSIWDAVSSEEWKGKKCAGDYWGAMDLFARLYPNTPDYVRENDPEAVAMLQRLRGGPASTDLLS